MKSNKNIEKKHVFYSISRKGQNFTAIFFNEKI